MREIKFRAWDKKKKSMYPVKEISFLKKGFLVFVDVKYQGSKRTQVIEDTDAELMQYTGLKDKNGKEIYEGDIVKRDGRICAVGWYTTGLKFALFTTEATAESNYVASKNVPVRKLSQPFPLWNKQGQDNYTEVIGNIYENPELLK